MRTKRGAGSEFRTGLAPDRDVAAALDEIVKELAAFDLTRSEVAGAILGDFLEPTPNYKSKAMEPVARYRIRRP